MLLLSLLVKFRPQFEGNFILKHGTQFAIHIFINWNNDYRFILYRVTLLSQNLLINSI